MTSGRQVSAHRPAVRSEGASARMGNLPERQSIQSTLVTPIRGYGQDASATAASAPGAPCTGSFAPSLYARMLMRSRALCSDLFHPVLYAGMSSFQAYVKVPATSLNTTTSCPCGSLTRRGDLQVLWYTFTQCFGCKAPSGHHAARSPATPASSTPTQAATKQDFSTEDIFRRTGIG